MAQLPPATLQVLPPPPTAREATASHAVPRSLPRIVAANATSHPPPSLNSCRTAAARGPDSAPALWYWQLTGEEWLGDSHSYELAKKRWRRMPAEHKAAERSRDRSGQKRPADDSAKVAQRVRVKREAEKREAATAYRVVDMHTHVSADGRVHLLVAPSEVAAERLEPVAAERASCETLPLLMRPRSIAAVAGHLPRPRVLPSALPLGLARGHEVEGLQVEAGCARRCACAGTRSKGPPAAGRSQDTCAALQPGRRYRTIMVLQLATRRLRVVQAHGAER